MQFFICSVPAIDGQKQTDELNAFIRGHKIIDVERRFVENGDRSYWSFCVRYTQGALPVTVQAKKERVDYREVLSEQHFQVFSKLRQVRKLIAEEEAIPAYAIFTDEELSKIAQLPQITLEAVKTVPGIGEKKTQKYASQLIQFLQSEAT